MALNHSIQPDRVAVIMRTRDRPQFLPRAIQSVLSQTFGNWSLVVINNGDRKSVDQCCHAFSAPLAGRLTIVDVPDDVPVLIGSLTNIGIQASQSRWITVLDDDDTWEPAFLQRTVENLTSNRRHPNVLGVVTQSQMVEDLMTETGVTTGKTAPFNAGLRRIELLSLAAANLFTGNAFVYERSALERVGLYSEILPVLDDWDFNLRFALQYDIDVIPEPLANYHRRPASKATGNQQHTPADLHEFYHAKIVNDRLRADLEKGDTGMGWLMAFSSRLRSQSEKIGKIDQRTREMKKGAAAR